MGEREQTPQSKSALKISETCLNNVKETGVSVVTAKKLLKLQPYKIMGVK